MQNDYRLESFHHFDGVNHLDKTYNEEQLIFAPFNDYVWVYKNDGTKRKVSNGNAIGMAIGENNVNGTIMVQLSSGEYVMKSSLGGSLTPTQIIDNANQITTQSKSYVSDNIKDAIFKPGGILDDVKDFGSSIFSSLKWFIIAAVIIGLIVLFLKLKKEL